MDNCDYSFGDHASVICNVFNGYMKQTNLENEEFISVVEKIGKTRIISLFVDNIRLYKRHIDTKSDSDAQWVESLTSHGDVLNLCSQLPEYKFRIITGLDDTPIDYHIEGRIPRNVVSVHAVNCDYVTDKLKPLYLGLQRRMNPQDNRIEILKQKLDVETEATKLLYVNHKDWTNMDVRGPIKPIFQNYNWATVRDAGLEYGSYLDEIKNHHFMICPIGNGIDCHRNYEVFYMKRVPVMVENEYLKSLYQGLPVLWVKDWKDVTEQLLADNMHLCKLMQHIVINELDWKYYSHLYQ